MEIDKDQSFKYWKVFLKDAGLLSVDRVKYAQSFTDHSVNFRNFCDILNKKHKASVNYLKELGVKEIGHQMKIFAEAEVVSSGFMDGYTMVDFEEEDLSASSTTPTPPNPFTINCPFSPQTSALASQHYHVSPHASPPPSTISPNFNSCESYSLISPSYSPFSPRYSPGSPGYSPTTPSYSPASPGYSPTSQSSSPTSSIYSHTSDVDTTSTETTDNSHPQQPSTSGLVIAGSLDYANTENVDKSPPAGHIYSSTSPSYSTSSPSFSHTSPSYSPTSPSYSPTTPSYSPTSLSSSSRYFHTDVVEAFSSETTDNSRPQQPSTSCLVTAGSRDYVDTDHVDKSPPGHVYENSNIATNHSQTSPLYSSSASSQKSVSPKHYHTTSFTFANQSVQSPSYSPPTSHCEKDAQMEHGHLDARITTDIVSPTISVNSQQVRLAGDLVSPKSPVDSHQITKESTHQAGELDEAMKSREFAPVNRTRVDQVDEMFAADQFVQLQPPPPADSFQQYPVIDPQPTPIVKLVRREKWILAPLADLWQEPPEPAQQYTRSRKISQPPDRLGMPIFRSRRKRKHISAWLYSKEDYDLD